VQLRGGVSTPKVASLVGISQSFVAHVRKEVGVRLRDKEEGVQNFLQTDIRGVVKRSCVTLISEGRLGTAFAITKQV
jgi:hypothetical protein